MILNAQPTRPFLDGLSNAIEQLTRDHRSPVTVMGARVLPGYIEFLARPHPNTRLNHVKALDHDLALRLGRPVRIALSGTHIALQVEIGSDSPISLEALMENALTRQQPPMTAVLGISERGGPLYLNLASARSPHILIAGTTGCGKTVLAQSIVNSLIQRNKAREIGIIVMTAKPVDGDPFMQGIASHLLMPPVRTPQDVRMALAKVLGVMDRRKAGIEHKPHILIYIDEAQEIVSIGGEPIVEALKVISQRGREPGIHLLVCTQRPGAKELSSVIKANLPVRLIGNCTSADEARIATGRPKTGAELLPSGGHFLAVFAGGMLRFRAAVSHYRAADDYQDFEAATTVSYVPATTAGGTSELQRQLSGEARAPELIAASAELEPAETILGNPLLDKGIDVLIAFYREFGNNRMSKNAFAMAVFGKPYAGQSHCLRVDKLRREADERMTKILNSTTTITTTTASVESPTGASE